jgi:hypothetical protein
MRAVEEIFDDRSGASVAESVRANATCTDEGSASLFSRQQLSHGVREPFGCADLFQLALNKRLRAPRAEKHVHLIIERDAGRGEDERWHNASGFGTVAHDNHFLDIEVLLSDTLPLNQICSLIIIVPHCGHFLPAHGSPG